MIGPGHYIYIYMIYCAAYIDFLTSQILSWGLKHQTDMVISLKILCFFITAYSELGIKEGGRDHVVCPPRRSRLGLVDPQVVLELEVFQLELMAKGCSPRVK